jgi:hypothetical protein
MDVYEQEAVVVMIVWFLNAIFNNISVISWPSVLLVEEIGSAQRKLPTCHKHIISHNVVSSTPHLSGIQTHNFSGDRH